MSTVLNKTSGLIVSAAMATVLSHSAIAADKSPSNLYVPATDSLLDKLAQNPVLRPAMNNTFSSTDQGKYSPQTPTPMAPSDQNMVTTGSGQALILPSPKGDGNQIAPTSSIVNDSTKVLGTVQFTEATPRPESGPGTTILQSLDEALVKSPRAAAIRAQLNITRSAFAEAAAQPNAGLFFDRGPYAEQVRRIGPSFSWEPPWKLVFRLLATKRLVDQARTDLMAALWTLRADVRRAYTEAVVAQETVETLNSLYDLASKLSQVSEKRFQAGDVPELDVLKARLATSQADVERQVGQRRVIRAKQQLNIIMGRSPETPINIPRLPAYLKDQTKVKLDENQKNQLLPDFDQDMPPLNVFIGKALEQRLELQSIAQRLKLNDANLRTAYGNVIPNPAVSFGSSVSGNAPTGPKLSSIYVSLNIETPLTNWNQGEIFRLKAVGRQLKYEMDSQKNIISQQVSSAYNNVLAARQKLKVYQDHVLADSYEVARLSRRSYEVGQSDITATLQVQQANISIRGQYLDAVRLYQDAYTELEQACGRPLEY